MEEKKRRPRLVKPDQGFSLKERTKTYFPAKDENSSETSDNNDNAEKKPFQEREQRPLDTDRPRPEGDDSAERKPWQDRERRPYDPDRPRPEGGERKPWQDRERRPYDPDRPRPEGGYGERKPWQDRERRPYDPNRPRPEGGYGERKPWQDREQRPYDPNRPRPEGGERKPWQDRERRPYDPNRPRPEGGGYGERKPWQDREQRPYDPNRPRPEGGGYGERKPWQDRERRPYDPDRPRPEGGGYGERKPWQDRNREGGGGYGERRPYDRKPAFGNKKPFRKKEEFYVEKKPKPGLPTGEGMPLNKYLAHCGLASRRKGVEYVKQGLVTVNGEVKTEPHYRLQAGDVVTCEGKVMTIQERQMYILMNKPKNVITTTEDEHGRATVLDIVDPHFPERLYPVGRLDRDTTGLLLLTNDGDLAQKLSHPSYHIQKQYRVGLDRGLSKADFDKISEGVELEDGPIQVNWLRYAEDHPLREVVELEIVVGRNRIVRRLFESLGYQVKKLDRFYYAGLTKKDLPRGSFRELTQREIVMLKHFTGHPSTGGKREMPEDEGSENETEAPEEL